MQSNHKLKTVCKAFLFCAVFTGLFVALSSIKNFFPGDLERLLHGITGTLAALLTTVAFLKFDRNRFFDIGLTLERRTVCRFLTGVLIGVVIMGLLATSVLYFSRVRVEVNPASNIGHFLLMTFPLIPLAFMEELGFRAYPLQILKGKAGIRLSIAITSILFALYHIACGWTVASSFLGPAIWGIVFGLAAVSSNGIAMPTGIHYAANLTTSAFGAANNTVCLWTIKQATTATTESPGTDWSILLPALVLFVSAILCLEVYMRQKTLIANADPKVVLTDRHQR